MIPGLRAHGELVSEIPGAGISHAGDAEVLTQERGLLEVEVVQGNDSVEFDRAGEVADAGDQVFPSPGIFVSRQIEDVFDVFTGPGFVFQVLGRQEIDPMTQTMTGLEKGFPFEIGRNA